MGGGGTESKKQLGKILLQQKRVPADAKREPTMRPVMNPARQAQVPGRQTTSDCDRLTVRDGR